MLEKRHLNGSSAIALSQPFQVRTISGFDWVKGDEMFLELRTGRKN
jgi:hypothetical protein